MRNQIAIVALTLLAGSAHAAGVTPKPPKPPEPPPVISHAEAHSSSHSAAGAVAVSHNENTNQQAQGQIQGQQQGQVATGGDATATGGSALGVGVGGDSAAYAHGGEGGSATAYGGEGGDATALAAAQGGQGGEGGSAQASSGGNTMTVQTTYRTRRQAPPIAQGGLAIAHCGAGANAGGSGTGGAGFLGVAWTPRECHKYITASNYAALGMYSMACAILNTTRATRRTVEELGIDLPSCDFHETRTTVEEVRYVTEDELDAAVLRLQESQERAWRSVQEGK